MPAGNPNPVGTTYTLLISQQEDIPSSDILRYRRTAAISIAYILTNESRGVKLASRF